MYQGKYFIKNFSKTAVPGTFFALPPPPHAIDSFRNLFIVSHKVPGVRFKQVPGFFYTIRNMAGVQTMSI
jgi:hypothetical protein